MVRLPCLRVRSWLFLNLIPDMIKTFGDMYSYLRQHAVRRRMVAMWAMDEHTVLAAAAAQKLGFIDAILVGDENRIREICKGNDVDASCLKIVNEPDEFAAIDLSVNLIREGKGDFLMKGLCSSEKFLRAILNKESGLLPKGGLLLHVGVMESPNYHKLLFMGDNAVIPLPDYEKKKEITRQLVKVAHAFGLESPKVAFISATEQVLRSQPATEDAAMLTKWVERGEEKIDCIADGPLALDVAIDSNSARIKNVRGSVAGDADVLVFPNLESSNVFWKTNSKLCRGVKLAGMLVGTTVPCVLASRADDMETKLNSIAEAVMFVK